MFNDSELKNNKNINSKTKTLPELMSVTEYLHDLKASPYRELPFTWENVKCVAVASPDEVPESLKSTARENKWIQYNCENE